MKISNALKQNLEGRTIKNITKDLKKIKHVKAAILFGSYARGNQKPISDIDICVLTSRDSAQKASSDVKSEIFKIGKELADIESVLPK